MPTECSADLFGFAVVEGRTVAAGFDGGRGLRRGKARRPHPVVIDRDGGGGRPRAYADQASRFSAIPLTELKKS
jgi:hypothetical protein